jgi:DNA-directed RNA polymerase II subunit RPB2
MVHKLLNAFLGKSDEDDRDHYGKKRLDMTGFLMTSLFKDLFRKNFIDPARKKLQTKLKHGCDADSVAFKDYFNSMAITNTLRNSLATGNWGRTATGEIAKTGVSQVLKRDTTYFASLSHLRRVVAPIKASSKTQKPRLLHNTHYGMICPS